METYYGYIETVQDALLVFESCRVGQLPRVHRRLNERERHWLRSGSVYVWDEEESDVRRWTDGRLWSPSRIRGRFLVYRELSCRRTEAMDIDTPIIPHDRDINGNDMQCGSSLAPADPLIPMSPAAASLLAAIPNPTRYGTKRLLFKPRGLIKRTIAVETSSGRRLHLISYFSEADLASGALPRPRFDPNLSHIQIPREIYPDLHQLQRDSDNEEHSTLDHVPSRMASESYMDTQTITLHDATKSASSYVPHAHAMNELPPNAVEAERALSRALTHSPRVASTSPGLMPPGPAPRSPHLSAYSCEPANYVSVSHAQHRADQMMNGAVHAHPHTLDGRAYTTMHLPMTPPDHFSSYASAAVYSPRTTALNSAGSVAALPCVPSHLKGTSLPRPAFSNSCDATLAPEHAMLAPPTPMAPLPPTMQDEIMRETRHYVVSLPGGAPDMAMQCAGRESGDMITQYVPYHSRELSGHWQPRTDEDRRLVEVLGAHLRL